MLHRISVACIALLFIAGVAYSQVTLDFEDGSLDDWQIVDDVDLGDAGPSAWEIRDSQGGLDGKALYQGSNIWGSAGDTSLMGTFIIYMGQKFSDFTLEVDVAASDNDGMGIVWAYESTSEHYRAIMINDGWPSPPLDGFSGPFVKMAKRISDAEPWYELLEVLPGDEARYAEGSLLHWTLTVAGGSFTLLREDGITISATDNDYADGYIGIQLYAQQAEFDNIVITPDTASVEAVDKMATVWGAIKGH